MITDSTLEVNHGWHQAIQLFFYQVHGRLKHIKLNYYIMYYLYNLHTHLSIVDQVLAWVVAGELVNHLLVIGDGSCVGCSEQLSCLRWWRIGHWKILQILRVPPLQWTLRKVRVRVLSKNCVRRICWVFSSWNHLLSYGAGRGCLLCDGEIVFEDRWVSCPVRSPFTLVFEVLRVKGQQRLVVSIEIDGTCEDLEVHCLGAADNPNV